MNVMEGNGRESVAVTSAMCADNDSIRAKILNLRGVQVILDRDIAMLYGVETKVLNQAVKRNRERFPDRFMFQLTEEELENWKSQIVTSNPMLEPTIRMGIRRSPYAFTEQGVAMLSAVLKSDTAVRVSIQIMDAFSAMRRALASVAPILSRLDVVERRQIIDQQRNEERFDAIFKAMDGGDFPPQKVFFEGKHYDAYSFARKLIRKAKKSIVLVDNYCEDVTLDILSQKSGGADVTIATLQKSITKFISQTAVDKFNKQNPTLSIKPVGNFHDSFSS